jgi:hypothetical protein
VQVKSLAEQPVKYVFNTHQHDDAVTRTAMRSSISSFEGGSAVEWTGHANDDARRTGRGRCRDQTGMLKLLKRI